MVSKNISHYSNHVKSQYFLPSSKFSKYYPTSIIFNKLNIITYIPGSGSSDYTPDRPIGYGAFGVVWSVTDPRDGKRVALKKLPNVFQSLVSSKRVFRELKMMRFFKHDNVLSCLDILQVYLSRWSLPYMKKEDSALKSVKKIVKSLFTKKNVCKEKVQYESGYNKIIKNLANTNLLLHFLFNFGALWKI